MVVDGIYALRPIICYFYDALLRNKVLVAFKLGYLLQMFALVSRLHGLVEDGHHNVLAGDDHGFFAETLFYLSEAFEYPEYCHRHTSHYGGGY